MRAIFCTSSWWDGPLAGAAKPVCTARTEERDDEVPARFGQLATEWAREILFDSERGVPGAGDGLGREG